MKPRTFSRNLVTHGRILPHRNSGFSMLACAIGKVGTTLLESCHRNGLAEIMRLEPCSLQTTDRVQLHTKSGALLHDYAVL
jgi:hypothetical protein